MKRTKTKQPEGLTPLSDTELQWVGRRLGISRLSGLTPSMVYATTEERMYHELLAWRGLKRLTVLVDEHHDSMGTSHVIKVEGGKAHYGAFPMSDLGFKLERGQRYVILVSELPRHKRMRPRKNPYLARKDRRRAQRRRNRT